jgi:hypothetical protein
MCPKGLYRKDLHPYHTSLQGVYSKSGTGLAEAIPQARLRHAGGTAHSGSRTVTPIYSQPRSAQGHEHNRDC